jgi:hypothetical protein
MLLCKLALQEGKSVTSSLSFTSNDVFEDHRSSLKNININDGSLEEQKMKKYL